MVNVFNSLKKHIKKDRLAYVGVVRNSFMLVLFYIPKSFLRGFDSSNISVFSGGEYYDFEIIDESDFNFDKNEKIDSSCGKLISAKISLVGLSITDDVKFIFDGREIYCMDERYSLSSLVHHGYKDFQEKFSFAATRIVDEETVRYIAKNNILYSKALSGSVKVTSFSIYIYKSLSIGIVSKLDIEKFYEVAKLNVENLSEEERLSRSIRTDIVGRAASIALAYCHYLIAYGDLLSVKRLIIDLISFSNNVEQPNMNKTELEDHSYIFLKLVSLGLCCSWALKDDSSFVFLKEKAIDVYKYASTRSYSLPYVYLKEFGETYSLYTKLIYILQKEKLSLIDFHELIQIASRVKSKVFLDEVFKNLSKFRFENFKKEIVFSNTSSMLLKHSPIWHKFYPIKSGRYLFETKLLSMSSSDKGCIFCIKGGGDIYHSDKIKGLNESAIKSLGFFKYIKLKEGENSIRFEFEISDVDLDCCSIFIWDKNIHNVTCSVFSIMRLC